MVAHRDQPIVLREEGEFVLMRPESRQGESSSLVLTTIAERPSLESAMRLEHEYRLRENLDPEWAVIPAGLSHDSMRPSLRLCDPGGQLLSRLVGRSWDLGSFLRVGIAIATALDQLHQRGLVHRDIKPSNILVDDGLSQVWLTGFGIASRLPRERRGPQPADSLAGTLAYMAPEQTGRMNRSIDSRSDLYAFGVTLYELLTGALPFSASDAMEWIHCQIAKQPTPPHEKRSGTPEPVSDILMKLLAKAPEERYQTASGVAADLRCCLEEWEGANRIDRFPLGVRDLSNRLVLPEKLYGREKETDALLAAFERVVTEGSPGLFLVSGYSGIGKSSVVNEVHRVLVPPRGLFASGKFDQYKSDVPYATLAPALQSLVRMILGRSQAELERWREAIVAALGSNAQLMINLVPDLELVIGPQPPVVELSPEDAKSRFQMLLRRLLGVFARREHPLVLFLDDLQWLDAASLDFVEHLVTHPEVRHLLVVGAYRDNEVSPSHVLFKTLERIHAAQAHVGEIVLGPLALQDVERLLVDALHCDPRRASPLAQLVHEKTSGNPFFTLQFISEIGEERLIVFDERAMAWSWDLDRIRARRFTDNVVALMIGKLIRLPAETQSALRQLASIGNGAAVRTLGMIEGSSDEEVDATLWDAVRAGLIFRREGTYVFLHDRVQEAAYSMIPESERAANHLKIGRLLTAQASAGKREETVFEIANHFSRASALITSREEADQVAELNLIAGKRAKAAIAYESALKYLTQGLALLPAEPAQRRYELAFALELACAECEFLIGAQAAAEARLSELSQYAVTGRDRAAVACLQIHLFTTTARSEFALEACLAYFRGVGLFLSPIPGEEELQREYERMHRLLGDRSNDALLNLPLATDADTHATMDVFASCMFTAYFSRRILFDLCVMHATSFSLERGYTDGTSLVYCMLPLVIGSRTGNFSEAYRFGQVSIDLVEKRGLERYKARVYASFGNLVMPWTEHISKSNVVNRNAIETALESGDLTWGTFSRYLLITNLLASGELLTTILEEADLALALVRRLTRFEMLIDFLTAQRQLIRSLRGLTVSFGSFDDSEFDERTFERHMQKYPVFVAVAFFYWTRKLQALFHAEEYTLAVAAAEHAQAVDATHLIFEAVEFHYYGALSRAALASSAGPEDRAKHLARMAAHHRRLAVWARDCQENFADRVSLVGAEIARLEGRMLDAERLYEDAIRDARKQGFIQTEAVANEVAGRFYLDRGYKTIGYAYLSEARNGYLRWGMSAKVNQLDRRYPWLGTRPRSSPSDATIETSSEHLDVGTVVKASQALSSEIDLARLSETLMRLALEHAGAERGLLILLRDEGRSIEAEATTRKGHLIDVRLRQTPTDPMELPESMLHYVIRTRERLVIDDATADHQFSGDAYLRAAGCRSILFVPLMKQGRLVGVLYLENNLTAHAFTPARTAVLNLIASQAAIAIENARLYADVNKSERELRSIVDCIPTLTWRGRADGSVEFYNQQWLDYTGMSIEQAGGWGWRRTIHKDDEPGLVEFWRGRLASGTGGKYEARVRRYDGVYRWFAFRLQPFRDENGKVANWYGTINDIEDMKRAEMALDSRLQFETLRREVSVALASARPELLDSQIWESGRLIGEYFDVDNLATVWIVPNSTVHRMAQNWAREGFDPLPATADFADFPHSFQTVLRGQTLIVPSVRNMRQADRAKLEELSIRCYVGIPLIDGGETIGAMNLISRSREGEWSDETVRRLVMLGEVLANALGRRKVFLDLERSSAALQQAQSELSHITRVTTLGELAASIAHEVNQPLTAIVAEATACLNWLAGESPDMDMVRDSLGAVVKEGERAGDVLTRIRALLSRRPVAIGSCDMSDVIGGVLPLVRPELTRSGVGLDTRLESGLRISGDPVQLQQVLLNLILNAGDATREVAHHRRRVVLRSAAEELNGAPWVTVAVEDAGVGFGGADPERVFEAFYTTKSGGLGMGLSISRSIIERHGGKLWAQQNQGDGATFLFRLPASR